jgi:hypothetical protein
MIDLMALNQKELSKTKDLFLNFPWEDPRAYAEWLAQTYYMVNHSTRLVALAGAYAPFTDENMHCRFIDHAKEERGHALIAISDMKKLGYSLEDFPSLTSSDCMYQVQYYWIQHRGAVAFFGYTLALESLAAEIGTEVYQKVLKAHGEKATVFLKIHTLDDVGHMEKAMKQLSHLKEDEKALVAENLKISASIYRNMLIDIKNAASSSKKIPKKAA